MGIQGSGLQDKNVRLRFFIYVFMGVIALSSVLYWRSQLLVTSEYVEISKHDFKKSSSDNLRSKNFEIETIETSPSVN